MPRLSKNILAAYYNDARLNIMYCLNDIREKSGMTRIKNDAGIRSAFTDLSLSTAEPELQNLLIKSLRNRFRFIDVLTDPHAKSKQDDANTSPERYEATLSWMFELINILRNSMVHPTDNEGLIDHRMHKNLFFDLGKIYDASRKTIKERFSYDSKILEPLLRKNRDGIIPLFAPIYIGRGKYRKTKSYVFTLCSDPWDTENQSNIKPSDVLNDFGHVLLCSLFLDKTQSAELVSYFWQTGYDKDWNETEKSIIKELISVYRVILPIQRLKSDDTTTAATLDSLSELSRCPRTMLDSLHPRDQEKFRGIPGNETDTNADSNYLFARSNQDRFIPLMMRYLDFNEKNKLRFAIDLGQFYYNVRLKPADRFTDDRSRVRRLGQKILGYGKLTNFEDSEKPAGWKRLEKNYLESIEETKTASRTVSQEIQQLKPYIVETYPHYHYYDDKIGFRLTEKTKDKASYLNWDEEQVNRATALTSFTGRDMVPEFWMSPVQMVHFTFYSYLQNQQKDSITLDILLNRYRSGMKKLLNTVASNTTPNFTQQSSSQEKRRDVQEWLNKVFSNNQGKDFSVTLSDLPKVLVNHLLGTAGKERSAKEIIERAKHMLERTNQRKEQIAEALKFFKQRGQKGFSPIKCGNIGDFLADDLMRFQPVDTNKPDGGKLNSQHYQILQAALAYYGAHIDEPPCIVDLLDDAGLLSGEFAHPFLGQMNLQNNPNQYPGLISFYRDYLKFRGQYLQAYIDIYKTHVRINYPPKWLKLRQHSTLANWLKEQINNDGNLIQPLPVPKNMLYQPILSLTAKALGTSSDALYQAGIQHFTRNGKPVEIRPTVNWLIKHYLSYQDDGMQKMYSYPRNHRVFDSLLDDRNMKSKDKYKSRTKHYLSEDERKAHLQTIQENINAITDKEQREKEQKPLRAYKRSERKIRHYATQDMLLYLFTKHYLDENLLKLSGSAPAWSLQNLENDLLNTAIHYELPVPDSDKILFHPECKIRNLGELRLLVRDRRLPSLLEFYKTNEKHINQAEIRAELASYRRSKVKIMEQVHTLEKSIIKYCGDVPIRSKEARAKTSEAFGKARHGDFLHYLHTYIQQQSNNASDKAFQESQFYQALQIRNAFSHNHYPETQLFAAITKQVHADNIHSNPTKHRKVAERLLDKIISIYQPWLTLLK